MNESTVQMAIIVHKFPFQDSEYDHLFKLTKKSTLIDGCYVGYQWDADKPHLLKGADVTELFPAMFKLYLAQCTDDELNSVLSGTHFLKITAGYLDNECQRCFLSMGSLTLAGLNDPKYRQLIVDACPSDMLPAVVELGAGVFWHLMGINKIMWQNRELLLGMAVCNPGTVPSVETVYGTAMLGRDSYPSEVSEEQIKEHEHLEDIFIRRKQWS